MCLKLGCGSARVVSGLQAEAQLWLYCFAHTQGASPEMIQLNSGKNGIKTDGHRRMKNHSLG